MSDGADCCQPTAWSISPAARSETKPAPRPCCSCPPSSTSLWTTLSESLCRGIGADCGYRNWVFLLVAPDPHWALGRKTKIFTLTFTWRRDRVSSNSYCGWWTSLLPRLCGYRSLSPAPPCLCLQGGGDSFWTVAGLWVRVLWLAAAAAAAPHKEALCPACSCHQPPRPGRAASQRPREPRDRITLDRDSTSGFSTQHTIILLSS